LTWETEADADPPAELLAAIGERKAELLALLAGRAVVPPSTVPAPSTADGLAWDEAEAGRLVAEALDARDRLARLPLDAEAHRLLNGRAEALDVAHAARDLGELRKAVRSFLDAAAAAFPKPAPTPRSGCLPSDRMVCPVSGCIEVIRVDGVCCADCWRRLPESSRKALWGLFDQKASRAFKPLRRTQSAAFVRAMDEAIASVTRPQEAEEVGR